MPARPRKPRDKAKVEACVLIMERWILGRLRNGRFHSLGELNEAIKGLLVRLNDERPIRRLGLTRRQLLEDLDRPALRPLPAEPYVFAEWRARRGGIDYHVDIDKHYYSVPHRFARTEVEVRLTGRTVEVFAKGERIPRISARAAMANTRPCKNTCPPATGVTPTGRSIASAKTPP